jgi:hypothetical protein
VVVPQGADELERLGLVRLGDGGVEDLGGDEIEVVAAPGPAVGEAGSDGLSVQAASRTTIAVDANNRRPVVRSAGMGSGYGRPVP